MAQYEMPPPMPPSQQVTVPGTIEVDDTSTIIGLRTQIKANAYHLFTHATDLDFGVLIITDNANPAGYNRSQPSYRALATHDGGFGGRKEHVAAYGPPSESVVAALQGLLHVLATAIEKYRGNVLKEEFVPTEVEGGSLNEVLIVGKERWKHFMGRK